MMSQNPRPAAPRLSNVPAPTCVCRNAGSVTETRTVPTELMRVSRLAAVSGTGAQWRQDPENTFNSFHLNVLLCFQCTPTTLVMWRTSSCARTGSVSPSTLCAIMTSTAPMALMNPQNAVSVCECVCGRLCPRKEARKTFDHSEDKFR